MKRLDDGDRGRCVAYNIKGDSSDGKMELYPHPAGSIQERRRVVNVRAIFIRKSEINEEFRINLLM